MTMKYGDKIIYMEGVIVEIHDGFEGTIRLSENPDENADYGLSISGRTGSWMEYEFCRTAWTGRQ